MCGIVGYIGPGKTIANIFEGLKRLEYRGYDSAGIAVLNQGRIWVEKNSGKLSQLEPFLHNLPQEGAIGIGHTRWATHGAPTAPNAHPHQAGETVIIHNGIIENYLELKENLQSLGVPFKSETDTEVIVHLLDREMKNGRSARDSICAVLERLEGAFALGIMFADDPKTLYIAKHGSPLAVGIGSGETFFASDPSAFVGKANKVIYLEDGDIAALSSESIVGFTSKGEDIQFETKPLNWSKSRVEKQGFRHFMLKEIHEQPVIITESVQRMVLGRGEQLKSSELGFDELELSSISRISIIACGTALYAGLVAKYFLEPLLGIPVEVEMASEFRYRQPYLTKQTLIISISQSGETADTLACVKYAKSLGCQTLSVCNTEHAAIPRTSTATLFMDAGQEIGVASTKAFTSQILCLYLWGLEWACQTQRLSRDELVEISKELRHLPILMEKVINSSEAVQAIARKYFNHSSFLYMGRGLSYPIALEGALKLKEISYIHAEGYAAGELKHGPIALIDEQMPVVAIAPNDRYLAKTLSNIEEIVARKGKVIGIGDPDNASLRRSCSDFIASPQTPNPVFQSLINAVPIQLFAYHMAVWRGTDVDQPRNLAKSVTVE